MIELMSSAGVEASVNNTMTVDGGNWDVSNQSQVWSNKKQFSTLMFSGIFDLLAKKPLMVVNKHNFYKL